MGKLYFTAISLMSTVVFADISLAQKNLQVNRCESKENYGIVAFSAKALPGGDQVFSLLDVSGVSLSQDLGISAGSFTVRLVDAAADADRVFVRAELEKHFKNMYGISYQASDCYFESDRNELFSCFTHGRLKFIDVNENTIGLPKINGARNQSLLAVATRIGTIATSKTEFRFAEDISSFWVNIQLENDAWVTALVTFDGAAPEFDAKQCSIR